MRTPGVPSKPIQPLRMNAHFLNRRLAYVLGIAGLLPFAALLILCAIAGSSLLGFAVRSQQAYGIAILSFLGGMHWGAAMIAPGLSAPQTRRALWWSVVPSLIGWISVAAGTFGLAVLALGFLLAYAADKRLYPIYPIPDWMLPLRFWLTAIVVACLLLTLLIVNARA